MWEMLTGIIDKILGSILTCIYCRYRVKIMLKGITGYNTRLAIIIIQFHIYVHACGTTSAGLFLPTTLPIKGSCMPGL